MSTYFCFSFLLFTKETPQLMSWSGAGVFFLKTKLGQKGGLVFRSPWCLGGLAAGYAGGICVASHRGGTPAFSLLLSLRVLKTRPAETVTALLQVPAGRAANDF